MLKNLKEESIFIINFKYMYRYLFIGVYNKMRDFEI